MATLVVFSMPTSIRELQPDWGQKVAREDVAILKEMFPNQSIRVYSCKRRNFSQTIAVVYLLHVEHRISGDSGPAVGYGDDQCGYPPTDAINKFSPIPVAEQLKSLYPDIPKTSLINLTHATPSALAASGWGEPITPKGMFDATVRWWFREQP